MWFHGEIVLCEADRSDDEKDRNDAGSGTQTPTAGIVQHPGIEWEEWGMLIDAFIELLNEIIHFHLLHIVYFIFSVLILLF